VYLINCVNNRTINVPANIYKKRSGTSSIISYFKTLTQFLFAIVCYYKKIIFILNIIKTDYFEFHNEFMIKLKCRF
jgi:hypothetical protein